MLDALEDDYPANLRMVHNRPPFLMVRGKLESMDVRAMAVVGTRHPSPKGLDNAMRISRGLAARGVTVVSGLAAGIDSAAHRGAIEGGGRTVAVFGTGIDNVYPAQNAELAAQVASHGACVSQFWPAMRGARWTFPARNLVTSGLSIGTVVVEAGETSGARLQAIAALDHGKRVLLLRRWAESEPWAIEAARRPGVIIVESVDDVIDAVDRELLVDTSAAL
jgi:DNA processing protein